MTHHYHVMHTVFGGLKLAACWLGGLGVAMLADATVPVITPSTHVPIGAAIGICVAVLTAGMWVSRNLTKLQDGQEDLKNGQEHLKDALQKLPCKDWTAKNCPGCQEHKKHH